MNINNDELVVVLRALYWHVERLSNTDENVRDEVELTTSKFLRSKFSNELKRRSFID
jgi:hypothetical protein